MYDEFLGVIVNKRVEEYPTHYAFGGPHKPGDQASQVAVGNGRFYLLPVGALPLKDAQHQTLVDAAAATSKSSAPVATTPEVVEAGEDEPAATATRRKRGE